MTVSKQAMQKVWYGEFHLKKLNDVACTSITQNIKISANDSLGYCKLKHKPQYDSIQIIRHWKQGLLQWL